MGKILSKSVTGAYTIASGAKTIVLKNRGGSDATFTGDSFNNVASDAITIKTTEGFEFPAIPNAIYGPITVSGSGTTLEIVAFY